MELSEMKLSRLSLALKGAVTCLIVIVAGGLVASMVQMILHYENRDEQAGLTMDDLVGSFHGLDQPSRLLVSIKGDMRPYIPTDEEYEQLKKWLEGDRISEDYDNLDLGDYAPAEILSINCLNCHARNATEGDGVGERVPLEYWDDVKRVAFSKKIEPTPMSILVTTTHTHALTMPLVGIVACGLFLSTGWPRRLRHAVVFLTFFALLVDIGGWWLSRYEASFTYLIVAGGAGFGGLCGLQLLGAFLDTWFGRLFIKTPVMDKE
jgi:hypothetical protein